MLLGGVCLVALASCSGGNGGMPSNPEDACAIYRDRPHFRKAFESSERKWGVPASFQMALIYQESGFRATARPPKRYSFFIIPRGRASSARGYAQVLDGTWDDYRNGPGRAGASRSNIYDSADFIGWYVSTNNAALGISNTDARNSYLAYHEGRTGYARGSYKSKSWLLSTADNVAARAAKYETQLQYCSR
ncbi:transglycosylase SLT domain-containing protein [Celeribacter litoreus]|uniref:transglycosylase SLT domain-containing protein n=1 Tax=Celeribacter litoreus TaxID=2876714 RepID=UPI0037BEEE36